MVIQPKNDTKEVTDAIASNMGKVDDLMYIRAHIWESSAGE